MSALVATEEFTLTPVPTKRDRKLSAQQQLARRLQDHRAQVLGTDVAPDNIYTVARVNADLEAIVGYHDDAVLAAHALFLDDPRAQGLDPPCPLWAFARDFGKFVSASQRQRAGGTT